jgi:hypothetical protein
MPEVHMLQSVHAQLGLHPELLVFELFELLLFEVMGDDA